MMGKNQKSNAIPGRIASLSALIAVLFLLCVWNTQSACAEEARPCEEDIAQFCKDIKPGGGRIIFCLKSHESELSSVCKEKLQELQKRLENAKRACANDIEKFCKGIQEGEGRIAKCLIGRAEELSPACAEQLEWATTKTRDR